MLRKITQMVSVFGRLEPFGADPATDRAATADSQQSAGSGGCRSAVVRSSISVFDRFGAEFDDNDVTGLLERHAPPARRRPRRPRPPRCRRTAWATSDRRFRPLRFRTAPPCCRRSTTEPVNGGGTGTAPPRQRERPGRPEESRGNAPMVEGGDGRTGVQTGRTHSERAVRRDTRHGRSIMLAAGSRTDSRARPVWGSGPLYQQRSSSSSSSSSQPAAQCKVARARSVLRSSSRSAEGEQRPQQQRPQQQ